MTVMIIGGGASGMMAALKASQEHDVILLERQSRMARKLLATGNGRCNLTNRNLTAANYHGEQADFCRYALDYFGVEQTLDFFHSLGLLTVTDTSGKVYPFSDSANSVADVLRLPLEQRQNVRIVTGCEIRSLVRRKGKFIATSESEEFTADAVIVCCGGAAGAKLGGTDLGYRLLSAFGHSRTKLYPSLVQLRTDTTYIRALKGVRAEVCVSYGGASNRGEIQFTDYGVSGPVIFELSRLTGQWLTIDFLPDVSEEEICWLLKNRISAMPKLKGEDLMTGLVHNRLGRTLLRACDCSLEADCQSLAPQVDAIVSTAKHFSVRVLGSMGMEQAQVTAGGIRTEEFRPDTLESRICKGVYAAGEVLDIDGDCGGYNLQWAWSSGFLAGELRGNR